MKASGAHAFILLAVFWIAACGVRSTRLKGAGSTYAAPIYEDWKYKLQRADPPIDVDYSAVGSEEGIKRLLNGKVAFAGSDVRLTEQQQQNTKKQKKVIELAVAVGAVAPLYHVEDDNGRRISHLHFSCQVLAEILNGSIREWDAKPIQRNNQAAKLPSAKITVVYRGEGSGTTFLITRFLAGCGWRGVPNFRVRWPPGSIEVAGSEGVVQKVHDTPNSIGFAEYNYAAENGDVDWGFVQNGSGQFVRADVPSVRAARQDSLPVGSLFNPTDRDAYPISALTWLLVPDPPRRTTKDSLCRFLDYAMGQGQARLPVLGYAELPDAVIERQRSTIRDICPGFRGMVPQKTDTRP